MSTGLFPKALQAARMKLVYQRPFVSAFLYAFHPVPVEGLLAKAGGPVACDKWLRLYYDPVAVETFDVATCVFILYHECCHIREDHAGRLAGENQLIANLAGDCAIHTQTDTEPDLKPPTWIVRAKTFRLPENQTSEKYARLLRNLAEKNGEGLDKNIGKGTGAGNCGSAADGQLRPWEQPRPGESGATAGGVREAEQQLLRDIVAREIVESAQRGTIPADWLRWAKHQLKSVIPWQQQLASALRQQISLAQGALDYSMRRPSRRSVDFMMPSLRAPKVRVAIVGDTSGSMGDTDINRVVAETHGIIKTACVECVDFLSVDADVHTIQRNAQTGHLKLGGGGGTDMGVGIATAAALKPRADVCVVITDGATPWPESRPAFRVIVCLVNNTCNPDSVPEWATAIQVTQQDSEDM